MANSRWIGVGERMGTVISSRDDVRRGGDVPR